MDNNGNTNNDTTKVSQEINSTSLSDMNNLSIPQVSGALCFRREDLVGALRMQNASGLFWERRQYDDRKAARAAECQSTFDWPSKKNSVVRFAEPLPKWQRE